MKRKYEAPVMSFEDFELSANIAAGCSLSPVGNEKNFTNKAECGWFDGYDFIFTAPNTGCKSQGDEKLCYHVPTDTTNLFSS